MGRKNARYQIAVRNKTNRRFEIVASVDGLDVVTRRPASLRRRGYILDPHSTLRIDGFRVNTSQVAAFRFGGVNRSLAKQTYGAKNVGVIGVAVFHERVQNLAREAHIRETAKPFPNSNAGVSP